MSFGLYTRRGRVYPYPIEAGRHEVCPYNITFQCAKGERRYNSLFFGLTLNNLFQNQPEIKW